MSKKRWTHKKLNQLADLVEVLALQVQQMQGQIGLLSHQVEQTCLRLDRLTEVMHAADVTQPTPAIESTSITESDSSRLTRIEFKLNQIELRLNQGELRLNRGDGRLDRLEARLQVLEGRQEQVASVLPPIRMDDSDEIEDEPDEVLWDFLDPVERGRRF
jgi:phage shock protein A